MPPLYGVETARLISLKVPRVRSIIQWLTHLISIGSEYWRFDSKTEPPVSKQYPKPIKNWVGLPNRIDAAFRWDNGMSYFFKGTSYYRFNDIDFEVSAVSPTGS